MTLAKQSEIAGKWPGAIICMKQLIIRKTNSENS